MTETPHQDAEPDIPEEPPGPPAGGEAAIPDQPLGVAEDEPEDEALPGIPDKEPPTSG